MSTVLLIDLSSIAHPIWHTSQGSTNPNECSIQTVARVRALSSGQPYVAVCCDSGRSFRRDIDATYKAQRPETDATLQHQITLARETLVADGFPVWAVKGFEADDLIASATHWLGTAPSKGSEPSVVVASSDKDLLQLVSPRVTVHRLHTAADRPTHWDEATVQAQLGIRPSQVVDYLSLVGDASDNIKGADGIGAKKAAALLAKFGNLEDLYAALDKGESFQPSTLKALTEFRGRMETVRSLVRLRTDVVLPFEEVFRERVPSDTAVFDTEDTMSESEAPTALPLPVANGTEAQTSPSVPNGGDSGCVPTIGPQRIVPADSPEGRAITGQGLAVREPEVLPPPSADFSMQLEPRSLREAALLGQEMFKSRLFSAYGTPQGILSTILAGRELGLQAMASLRAVHLIDGKPTLSADLIRALVLKSGKAEYFRCTERTAEKATFLTKRNGDPEVSLTFTVAEAQAAGLVKKGSGWEKSPADMCVARASAKLARLVYADVVFNMYDPSEMDSQ